MAFTFALNHMAAPNLPLPSFLDLARSLGISAVEIRNDLTGRPILDGTPAAEVRSAASTRGISILSINALQRFNDWNDTREREAAELITYAQDCGAAGLVLVPVNDGSSRSDMEKSRNLRTALRNLAPRLDDAGIVGLVEPLGFATCSLRSKKEAAEAISESGFTERFRLVHDTFHHTLAGEPEIFPDLTRLVHISGVAEKHIPIGELQDAHRGLVDEADRIGNLGQIRSLLGAGYRGPFSFEPFNPRTHEKGNPAAELQASMNFISSHFRTREDLSSRAR